MLLDLKVRKKSGEIGTIRPYFHAAAPLNRRMLQTGVVGNDTFEGEASSQFMGKSGSQLHESLNSESRTNSASASAGFSIGGVRRERFGAHHEHRPEQQSRSVADRRHDDAPGLGRTARTR